MKICTINIPNSYLECIEVLVDMGFYPSRSEAVRTALKQFLGRESEMVKEFEVDNFKQLKSDQLQAMISIKQ